MAGTRGVATGGLALGAESFDICGFIAEAATLAKESGLGGACSVGAGVADAMFFGGSWCNSSEEQEIAISDGLSAVRRLCSNTASKASPSLRGLVKAGSFQ